MGALRSAVDELASEELDLVPDRNLLDQVAELSRDIAALEAQRSRRIAEIDRRLAFEADGALRDPSQPLETTIGHPSRSEG